MNKLWMALCLLLLAAQTFGQQNNKLKKDSLTTKKDTSSRNLNEVNINSKYYKKYKIDRSSNTLKLKTPLLQLPQNIQEVDQSIITDQQAINVSESLTRNVSGAIRNNTADFYGPGIFMRGAAINTLRNGIDLSMIYFGPMPEDAGIIDRMEFIKGPAGFVNAIGDPAGSFNIVTKSPTGENKNSVNFTTGSFNLYRLTADLDGNLDKDKKWQYRLNVVGQKAKSFEKYAFNDKFVIDPVLKYNINAHSSLTAEYIYQKQSFMQYLLTVFSPYGFASLPKDFSITDPNKDPTTANEKNGFLTYHNQFNEHWQFTAKAAYVRSHMDGNYFFVSAYDPKAPGILQRRVTYEDFNTDVFALQTFLNGEFKTGKINHQILAGLDFNQKNLLAYSGYNDKNANPKLYPLDVNNPVYGINFDSNKKEGNLKDFATDQQAVQYYAAYLQDEMGFFNNKLRLTVAGRLTASKSSIQIPTVSSVSDVVFTPRFGLSYSILPDFSVYSVFDHTYTPQNGISASGGVFEPLRGKNIEAGLKKDWAGGKWNSSLSFYNTTRDNVIVTDPVSNLKSQIGEIKAKGIEIDLKGEIVKGLNVVINYAYTDAYVSKDANPKNVGLPSPYRVKHIQNTWLNYKLPFEELKGFSVSGGYQFQAGREGRYPQDGDISVANVFRLDGGLGWTNGKISVNGIVNNVLNRFNYGSAWTRPAALYAYVPFPPREFRLSVGYNF